jgi:hypothetical protein
VVAAADGLTFAVADGAGVTAAADGAVVSVSTGGASTGFATTSSTCSPDGGRTRNAKSRKSSTTGAGSASTADTAAVVEVVVAGVTVAVTAVSGPVPGDDAPIRTQAAAPNVNTTTATRTSRGPCGAG